MASPGRFSCRKSQDAGMRDGVAAFRVKTPDAAAGSLEPGAEISGGVGIAGEELRRFRWKALPGNGEEHLGQFRNRTISKARET